MCSVLCVAESSSAHRWRVRTDARALWLGVPRYREQRSQTCPHAIKVRLWRIDVVKVSTGRCVRGLSLPPAVAISFRASSLSYMMTVGPNGVCLIVLTQSATSSGHRLIGSSVPSLKSLRMSALACRVMPAGALGVAAPVEGLSANLTERADHRGWKVRHKRDRGNTW